MEGVMSPYINELHFCFGECEMKSYISSEFFEPGSIEPPHGLVQLLGKHTIDQLYEIFYDYLPFVACFLHPGLKTFNFCTRSAADSCSILGWTVVWKCLLITSEQHSSGDNNRNSSSRTSINQSTSLFWSRRHSRYFFVECIYQNVIPYCK